MLIKNVIIALNYYPHLIKLKCMRNLIVNNIKGLLEIYDITGWNIKTKYLENPIPCKDYEKHLKDAKKSY